MLALALFSGGLDSIMATKIMLDQGIEVVAVNFTSPFCLCGKGGCGSSRVAQQLNIPLKVINVGEDYLRIIKSPKHGYGRNMNPCIDCRIFMIRKAKKYAKEMGASFIFTGEVLGERPMSQHRKALDIIEKETSLKGKILRPLSAKLLPETEAEKKRWIKRGELLDIRGRSRKRQIALAEQYGMNDYPCPSGGCLLTYKEFADKVRDLFKYKIRATMKDIPLLKVGRHFRYGKNKIIVGRSEAENKQLLKLRKPLDYFFEVPNCGSPITLLQGSKNKKAIEIAASLTARYSDVKEKTTTVKFGAQKLDRSITVLILSDDEIGKLRIEGK